MGFYINMTLWGEKKEERSLACVLSPREGRRELKRRKSEGDH